MNHDLEGTLQSASARMGQLRRALPSFRPGFAGSREVEDWPIPASLAEFLRREWTGQDVSIATVYLHPIESVMELGGFLSSRLGFLPIGRCEDGDLIALEFTSPHLPVYVLEMTALVSSFRTAEDGFAIRIADSLPSFLRGLIDGTFWPHDHWFDYYVAEELAGERFPEPEGRPPVSESWTGDGDASWGLPPEDSPGMG